MNKKSPHELQSELEAMTKQMEYYRERSDDLFDEVCQLRGAYVNRRAANKKLQNLFRSIVNLIRIQQGEDVIPSHPYDSLRINWNQDRMANEDESIVVSWENRQPTYNGNPDDLIVILNEKELRNLEQEQTRKLKENLHKEYLEKYRWGMDGDGNPLPEDYNPF